MARREHSNRVRRERWVAGRRVSREYVHRIVVNRHLGRRLCSKEVVHHINGNPRDNRPDNLVAFTSQSAHMRVHHYLTRQSMGIGQLYPLDEVIRVTGDSVVWGTLVGLTSVFGEDAARILLASIEGSREASSAQSILAPIVILRAVGRARTNGKRHSVPLSKGGSPFQ